MEVPMPLRSDHGGSNQLQIVGQPYIAIAGSVMFHVRDQRRTLLVTITNGALFALHGGDEHILNTHNPLELVHLQAEAILSIVARKLAAGENSDTGIMIDEGDVADQRM
jgi:hypothetical protein